MRCFFCKRFSGLKKQCEVTLVISDAQEHFEKRRLSFCTPIFFYFARNSKK